MMMASMVMGLAAGLAGWMLGHDASQSAAFRQMSLAWYTRKRTVWVQVWPVDGVWTVTDVLPENPCPGTYCRYHRAEIDLSWFGVDSAWRARCQRYSEQAQMWKYLLDSLRRSLAAALDAHPASTAAELTELLASRDMNPWTEEVPTEEGHYLVAHAPRDEPEVFPKVDLWRFYRDHSRGMATSIDWSKLWPGHRIAFRRIDVDSSRVWAAPSWSERKHQARLKELRAASDAAQAAFLEVMDEEKALMEALAAKEQAMRARVEEAKRRKEEAFRAWEDELLRDPP